MSHDPTTSSVPPRDAPFSRRLVVVLTRLRTFGILNLLGSCGLMLAAAPSHAQLFCHPAEIVRVTVAGTLYKLPAEYQPDLFGRDKFPRRSKYREGHLRWDYCQRTDDPAAPLDSFSLGSPALNRIASQRPEFPDLRGMLLLSVDAAPAAEPPTRDQASVPAHDGLFRRIDHVGSFQLISTEPLIFGAHVTAPCSRAGTREPSNACNVRARVPGETLVRVMLNDATHPPAQWKQTFGQVEKLIVSFWNEPVVGSSPGPRQ